MKRILFVLPCIFFVFCSNPEKKSNPKIEIYDPSIESIINKFSEIEILADSIALPEGPVWDSQSQSLLFVYVINKNVHICNEKNGVSEYISPSGNTGYAPNLGEGVLGANGLALDQNGNLILCQHGDRRIAMIQNSSSLDATFNTLVDNYEGKRLNSPNDLTIASDGSFYFTDPPFAFFDLNAFSFVETEMRELDFNGVYQYDPSEEKIELITKDIDLPNGIALSPNEKVLYVNKMGMLDQNPQIVKIDLETRESEILFEGKKLAEKYEGNFDGMKVHSSGTIFTSGPGGLLVISPEGELKARIDFGHITNCAFDQNEEYLYVTGFVSNPKVFRIKLSE
ncbi:MAG: SMP-30/gluconolactonase/LRE family protein [Flavobacteriaceae bacterium]